MLVVGGGPSCRWWWVVALVIISNNNNNNNNNLLNLFNLLSYYAQWPWRPGGTPQEEAAIRYPLHKLVLIFI